MFKTEKRKIQNNTT